jgi:hypothetical protein
MASQLDLFCKRSIPGRSGVVSTKRGGIDDLSDTDECRSTDSFPPAAYPACKDAALASELSAKRLEFCAAGLAEIAEKID